MTVARLKSIFGDTACDIQHIDSPQWGNYVNFRDYMNTFPENMQFTSEQIAEAVQFQEKYYKSRIEVYENEHP